MSASSQASDEAIRRSPSSNNPLRIVLQMVLGAVVLFFGLSVLVGGISNAGAWLFVAVVCTAGVSLTILAPLSWAVGWLVWEFVGAVRSATGLTPRAAAQ